MNLQLYKAISAARWKFLPNGRLILFLSITNILAVLTHPPLRLPPGSFPISFQYPQM